MIGAAVSIALLCLLLVFRVPMLISIASAVILNFYFSGAWALTLPQTMLSGMNRFVLIALPLFLRLPSLWRRRWPAVTSPTRFLQSDSSHPAG